MRKKIQKILHNQLQKSAFSRAKFTLLGVIWRESQLCFVQFFYWRYPIRTLIHTFIVLFSAWTRLLLGRSVKYSFSHYAEDKVIEGILKPLITVNGFYVEVGCNHPVFLSNTYGLYRKGWRGICVDANDTLIQKYKILRPKDHAICALVSSEEKQKDFYIGENDVLSTTETNNLIHEDAKGIDFQKLSLNSRKLTSILDELNAPKSFDLLAIDAEEHDFEVLKSLDFEKYHPQLVMIEDETFDMSKPHENVIFQWITNRGYRCEGFVLKNIYFVRLTN